MNINKLIDKKLDYKNVNSISNVLDVEINNILNKNLKITNEKKNKTILVLGGGGIKGFTYIGVLKD